MATDRYESTFVVDIRGSGDFTDVQPAIDALPATGGKIFVKAGVYSLNDTVRITTNNVQLQGEGMGITVFVASDQMMNGNPAVPALEAFRSNFGTPRPLTADTARGDTALRLSASDAASFLPNDYVLLFSNKSIDNEIPAKHAGEVKQIRADSVSPGILPVDDQVFDTYLQSDSAQVAQVTMLQNITLSDFSVTTNASSSTLRLGFTHFRFVENLQIQRVEVHDAFHSGIELQSVRNSKISDCFIHQIRDVLPLQPPQNERYGIVVGGASQNVSISGCRFSHTRHSVTTGGSSGTFQNGVQRNIVVAHCTSMLTDTVHFDTHQPAENVAFVGCVAIGGIGVAIGLSANEAYGFQLRARNCSIVGCSVLQPAGRGISVIGPGAAGASIVGNMIANVTPLPNEPGTGIFLTATKSDPVKETSHHTISGNVIKNCGGSAMSNNVPVHDLTIVGNVIENANSSGVAAAIQLADARGILLTGNRIESSGQEPAIDMSGGSGMSDNWNIAQNVLSGEGSSPVTLVGAASIVVNNSGYNPVGPISNPWPAGSGDLTNQVAAGTADPQSAAVYTVRHSPKTIVVSGGDVSQIAINGTITGLLASVFKLGIGETIAITYATSAPVTAVYSE
jgi:hypothetical protein